MLYRCFCCKGILKISQTKGLRGPKYGYIFGPSALFGWYFTKRDMEIKRQALPGETGAPEVYAIGDYVEPRKVINAICEGFRTARLI